MVKQAVTLVLMSLVCLPDLAGAGGRCVPICRPPLFIVCPPLPMPQPFTPTLPLVPHAIPSDAVPTPAEPLKKPMVVAEPDTKSDTKEPAGIRSVGDLKVPAEPVKPPPIIPEVKPEAPKIPMLIPKLPGNDVGLPPLAVPTPADPNGKVNANYPPRKARVQIVPVVAEGTVQELCTVGFFNRSSNDLTLTVNGKSVAFPKQSYVSLELPRRFTWSLEGSVVQATDVPAGAPGVEVIVRY